MSARRVQGCSPGGFVSRTAAFYLHPAIVWEREGVTPSRGQGAEPLGHSRRGAGAEPPARVAGKAALKFDARAARVHKNGDFA